MIACYGAGRDFEIAFYGHGWHTHGDYTKKYPINCLDEHIVFY